MPDGEPISAVLEARTPFNDYRPDDDKAVLTSKMLMPMRVGNASIVPLDDYTAFHDHRPLVLASFMAFPSFVAAMVFMLTHFVPLVFFVPDDLFLVALFVFAMVIVTMIVLCKSWNGYADCKRKSRSKAVANQFHLVHLRC